MRLVLFLYPPACYQILIELPDQHLAFLYSL